MKVRISMALLLALVAGVFVQAQDDKKDQDSGGCFKVTGDTIDNLKVEFAHPSEPDMSTPMGTARAWIAITDGRESFQEQEARVSFKWEDACAKAMQDYEKKLLSEQGLKDLASEREQSKKSRTRERRGGLLPVTLEKETTELDDGRVQITGTSHEYFEWDGEREEYSSPVRYTLKKGEDGKWRIDKVEGASENEDDEGNTTLDWYEDYGFLEMYYNYDSAGEGLDKVPALKLDTPESAALSLTGSLCRRWTILDCRFYDSVMDPYVDAMASLCTEEWNDYLKEIAGVGEEPKPWTQREVMSVRDGEEGVKIVRLKPETKWNGPLDIHVVKVGDVWKVRCAKRVDLPESEDGEEEYTRLDDIYAAKWSWPDTRNRSRQHTVSGTKRGLVKECMRNLMIATLMLAGGLYLFACSNANTGATPPQTIDRMVDTAGNTNVYEAAIDGMTWVTWPAQVKETLARLDGVNEVAVNGETRVATIIMKKGRKLDRSSVDTGFEDTGFSVKQFNQTREFTEDEG